jgi:peptidoglycan/xylan/chitin deacetylase (PgdA/CDA1 family)
MTLSPGDAYVANSAARTAITEWQIVAADDGTAVKVHLGGIEVYPHGSTKYPNGVVTICLDDSFAGHWTYARPTMGQFGYQATLCPIIDQIGTTGSMTLAQHQLLQNQLGWEIAAHASTMANHAGFETMTAPQIQADIATSLAWMQASGLASSGAYAYPLGAFGGGQDAAVEPLVDAARTIDQTLQYETIPVGQRYRLRSQAGVGGVGGLGVSDYTGSGGVLDECKAFSAWKIITIHDISSGASTDINQISSADFSTLIAGIHSRGIAVATFGDALRLALNP